MKVLLFGKTRTASRVAEETALDLRRAGHTVEMFAYRNTKLEKQLEPLLMSRALGVPLAAAMVRKVKRFAPDLVLAIAPFHWLPPEIFGALRALPGRPPMVAWIGDAFGAEGREAANLFDLIAYTDSGTLDLHRKFGFRAEAVFVPLAAMGQPMAAPKPWSERIDRLAFVASATPVRRALLSKIANPISLYGRDWAGDAGLARHVLDTRRIEAAELSAIYASHMGVLNIRHEQNVINGLNQRHFAPYVEGAPVLTDPMVDLERCFEPGQEVLVYSDAAEIDALSAEFKADSSRAAAIAEAGRKRVLAEHTYAHRLQAMARHLGVSAT